MKIKIILEKEDMKKIKISGINRMLNFYNNKNTEACLKILGDNMAEITIMKKENLKSICKENNIAHFDKVSDYSKWIEKLRRNNGSRRKTR